MEFDRTLPEKLAEASPRFVAPTWANPVEHPEGDE